MKLKNHNVVVTGSSRGIGADIARAIAAEGGQVAITYNRNQAEALALKSELKEISADATARHKDAATPPDHLPDHLVVPLNLNEESSIEEAFAQIYKAWSRVDALVNNAGVTKDQLLLRMSVADFDFVVGTNLRGSFLCIKQVAPKMLKARAGAIVNITSVIGQMGNAGQANYAASKAGLEGMSKALALEFAARKVRVNCVAPGFIVTDMTAQLSVDQKNKIVDRVPLNELGTGADVASAVVYLLGPSGRYVTGQTLSVNGGLLMP